MDIFFNPVNEQGLSGELAGFDTMHRFRVRLISTESLETAKESS